MAQARFSFTRARSHVHEEMPCIYDRGAKAFTWHILLPTPPPDMGQGALPDIPQIDEGRHAAGEDETTTAEC